MEFDGKFIEIQSYGFSESWEISLYRKMVF